LISHSLPIIAPSELDLLAVTSYYATGNIRQTRDKLNLRLGFSLSIARDSEYKVS
jgi:hypothetical protein